MHYKYVFRGTLWNKLNKIVSPNNFIHIALAYSFFRNQFIIRQMEIVWKQHVHGTDQLTDLLDKDDYETATFEIKKEER